MSAANSGRRARALRIGRIWVDAAMTLILLGLMSYALIGETTHELLGVTQMTLFVAHHLLNRRWSAAICKGRYTPYRVLQSAVAGLLFCLMLGQACSGIVLSKHLFAWLDLPFSRMTTRTLHMLGAYGGFCLMSLHLGLHWGALSGRLRPRFAALPTAAKWAVRCGVALVCARGAVAFVQRDVLSYLLMRNLFAFFDYDEPLVRFYADYLAMMILFVTAGHLLAQAARALGKPKGKP